MSTVYRTDNAIFGFIESDGMCSVIGNVYKRTEYNSYKTFNNSELMLQSGPDAGNTSNRHGRITSSIMTDMLGEHVRQV